MWSSLRKRYGRSRSVTEYDLEKHRGDGYHKSRFAMFTRKSSCHHNISLTSQRVHSEPTKRKYLGLGLRLSRSKNNSLKRKFSYGTISNSSRSSEGEDLDRLGSSNRVSSEVSVSRDESESIPSPDSPRRLAICAELEKCTLMENGESLLMGHKNLVIRDHLETYAYI